MSKTIKILKNKTKHCWFGRHPELHKKIPDASCPKQCPGGKRVVFGPGDEIHDDRGQFDLMLNDSGKHQVLCFGTPAEVTAELKELSVPSSAMVKELGFEQDGKIGVVFMGIHHIVEDITGDHASVLAKTGNRLAAAKHVAALEDAVKEKDEVIAALTAKLQESKRGAARDNQRQANVAAAVNRSGG